MQAALREFGWGFLIQFRLQDATQDKALLTKLPARP